MSAPAADAAPPRTFIKDTISVCTRCLTKVPAKVWQVGAQVVLEKTCPEHGAERALLASDARFYYRSEPGGGGSCGPDGCALFNHSCTLIFEITERCNLTCPTCFTGSSPQLGWHMPLEEFDAKLQRLLGQGKRDADIIQISGGEPTVHPQLEELIALAFERGVAKVYLNSNGVRLAKEPDLARRLGARWAGRLQVYLQFDGLRHDTYHHIRGAKGLADLKLQAIDNLLAAGLYPLPVMTVTRGVNMDEIGAVIRMGLERFPRLTSMVLQPAMYAGRYLNDQRCDRVTVGDVIAEVERQTDGLFQAQDFGPIPCSDPNCFTMAVAMRVGGKMIPVSRYFPKYETWADPGVADRIALFTDRLPQHMVAALSEDDMLDELLDLLVDAEDEGDLFGQDQRFFLVGIKPFQDAGSYDQDRVDKCCVHVVDREGVPVSLCEYNTLRRPKGLL